MTSNIPVHVYDLQSRVFDAISRGECMFVVVPDINFVQKGDHIRLRRISADGTLTHLSGSRFNIVEIELTAGWIQRGGTSGIEPGHIAIQLIQIPTDEM